MYYHCNIENYCSSENTIYNLMSDKNLSKTGIEHVSRSRYLALSFSKWRADLGALVVLPSVHRFCYIYNQMSNKNLSKKIQFPWSFKVPLVFSLSSNEKASWSYLKTRDNIFPELIKRLHRFIIIKRFNAMLRRTQ